MKCFIQPSKLAALFIIAIFTFQVTSCNEQINIPTTLPNNRVNVSDLLPRAKTNIRQGLEDEDPRVRANAIEVVAMTRTLEYMSFVEQLLADPYIPVRFAAALAVGDLKYIDARNNIRKLFKSADMNTKIAAAYALYRFGEKDKLNTIAEAISSMDMQVRANAAFILGKTGDTTVLQLLYWAKDDVNSDDKVKLQAVESIARLGDERIYPKLWTMILNINADDRVMGVIALGELGTEKAIGALTSQLSDEVPEVRLAAAQQLGKLGYITGQAEVLEIMKNTPTDTMDNTSEERIYTLAALAIGEIQTPDLIEYLPFLLKYNSKTVRLAASKAVILCDNVR